MIIAVIAFALLLQNPAPGSAKHKISVQKYVLPKYPPIARAAVITGNVELALLVDANGSVREVKVVSGHPLLKRVAVESMREWRFHCSDCDYNREFEHRFIFTFSLKEEVEGTRYRIDFPDSVEISTEPLLVSCPTGKIGRKHWWSR